MILSMVGLAVLVAVVGASADLIRIAVEAAVKAALAAHAATTSVDAAE